MAEIGLVNKMEIKFKSWHTGWIRTRTQNHSVSHWMARNGRKRPSGIRACRTRTEVHRCCRHSCSIHRFHGHTLWSGRCIRRDHSAPSRDLRHSWNKRQFKYPNHVHSVPIDMGTEFVRYSVEMNCRSIENCSYWCRWFWLGLRRRRYLQRKIPESNKRKW